jgi:hypothetical protein
MGIAYAIYIAVTDMEKTALIACSPAKTRRPSASARPASNQTTLTGVCVLGFILYSHFENGRAG